MTQVLGPGALGRPRGIGWRGRWEGGSGWRIHVNPWLIHVNVWQNPLQCCEVISLQLIKINEKKNKVLSCVLRDFQVALVVKNLSANAGDLRDVGLILGSGRCPGGGHGNPLQYSCLENPMDRGAWLAMVLGFIKSQTWLKQLSTHVHGFLSYRIVLFCSSKDNTEPSCPSRSILHPPFPCHVSQRLVFLHDLSRISCPLASGQIQLRCVPSRRWELGVELCPPCSVLWQWLGFSTNEHSSCQVATLPRLQIPPDPHKSFSFCPFRPAMTATSSRW